MTPKDARPGDVAGLDRRTLLRGAAVTGATVAAAGALAACSTDTGSATPTVPPDTTPPVGASSSSVDVTALKDVPVGGSQVVTVGGRKVVVTQPTAGQVKAFNAICTHSGCTVEGVTPESAGSILCPCHGSEFSSTDGSVVRGPANAPLAEIPVAVKNGEVRLA